MKVDINGHGLNYEVQGQSGTPIVLIHGYGLDHSIWFELAKKYLQNYRVIMPDVRGHGASDSSGQNFSMVDLCDDLYHLLEFLGIQQAVICGHSMGGYITLAFAEKYPDSVIGLGLVTSHAWADPPEKAAARYALVEAVRKNGAIALADSMVSFLTKDENLVKKIHPMVLATPTSGIIGAAKAMAERPDRFELLKGFQKPALIAAGEEDQIVPMTKAIKMAEALPQGILLSISGAGHLPMLEKPDMLGEGLAELMSRVENRNTGMLA